MGGMDDAAPRPRNHRRAATKQGTLERMHVLHHYIFFPYCSSARFSVLFNAGVSVFLAHPAVFVASNLFREILWRNGAKKWL
jgi:hypothetical protein